MHVEFVLFQVVVVVVVVVVAVVAAPWALVVLPPPQAHFVPAPLGSNCSYQI